MRSRDFLAKPANSTRLFVDTALLTAPPENMAVMHLLPPAHAERIETASAFEVLPEQRLVWAVLRGAITVSQIEEMMNRITLDPAYQLDFAGLIDTREMSTVFAPAELRAIALTIGAYPGEKGAKRAVVVGSELQFGLMRMLEAYTASTPVVYRAFRDEAKALQWLGLSPSIFSANQLIA